ncbi:redoxin domain-containing protein [Leptolyngbya sp. NK1-12]|uniref:Redoxin domain-containing protein n=1 Tax=Leptolyngbya sp. NK1-12 TaxID=2547451 RepID=A0AA96WFV0_9CYAN|nr:peroxiredoxin family protein [Leptolyngbya sp. NK1-12]WNZ24279.1 redoxin domain-containing protein [Leptolyngbya sp. NK1-12]
MLTATSLDSLLNRRFAQNFFPIPATNQFPLGTVAPPFELLNVTTGQKIRLADYLSSPLPQARNQGVLVAFTRIFSEKHYCPLCFPHIMELNAAYEQFVQQGIEVLMITSTDPQQSRIVLQELGLKMPLLSDPGCRTFRRYQVGQALGAPLPAQFLLDCQGRIRFRHLFSFIEPNASVERLLTFLEANFQAKDELYLR